MITKRYLIPSILFSVAVLLFLYSYLPFGSAERSSSDSLQQEGHQELQTAEETQAEVQKDSQNARTAILEDVTGSNATGTATSDYVAGTYVLSAQFENLPPLKEGYFYEGWVVRQGDEMRVISTGPTTVVDENSHINIFESTQDLTDHTYYVLTLEPDDGDPAPAEHILDGYFK